MKKSIVYWSPCLTKVGTMKSTLNSAISLAKYSENYDVTILNVFGEWSKFREYLEKKNVKLKNLTFNYYNFLPKYGFFKSRFSYILIMLISILPLIFFLKKNRPNYFIIHLITSLPLFLINIINFQTKVILRISGYPKMNFLRRKLWVNSQSKIYKITCPTNQLKEELINTCIFKQEKIDILSDAIINISDFVKKKNIRSLKNSEKIFKDYYLAAGRFTKQKNFIYLIREFSKFTKLYPEEKLLIIGEGEQKKKMEYEIDKLNLNKNIKLFEYTNNIFYFMKNSKAFILPSVWEEPGFVIIEASFCNTFIISSNCKNGPEEFLENGSAGLLFNSNSNNKLFEKLNDHKNLDKDKIFKMKLSAKKNSKKFTMFNHFLSLNKILHNY